MKVQISIQVWEGKSTGVGSAVLVIPYEPGREVRLESLNALVNLLPIAYDKAVGEFRKCPE